MTGAVRTGAARTATAERAICAGANASTEEQKASIRIPIDEATAIVAKVLREFRLADRRGELAADHLLPLLPRVESRIHAPMEINVGSTRSFHRAVLRRKFVR